MKSRTRRKKNKENVNVSRLVDQAQALAESWVEKRLVDWLVGLMNGENRL